MLTVLICTHNRVHLIPDLLAEISRLEPPSNCEVEILFVDNASKDGTYERLCDAVKTCPFEMRVVRETSVGLSHARNRGFLEARGEYVIMLDDDAYPVPHWLIAYARAFERWHPEVAGGPVVPFSPKPVPKWLDMEAPQNNVYVCRVHRGDTTFWLEPERSVWGTNMAIRRDVWQAVGGFQVGLGVHGKSRHGGEDTEFQQRVHHAGGRVLYVHDAAVRHLLTDQKRRFGCYLRQHLERGMTYNMVWGRIRWWRGGYFVLRHAGGAIYGLLRGRVSTAAIHVGQCMWYLGRTLNTLRGNLLEESPVVAGEEAPMG